eukprot:265438-Chlamydomonas_euryale.AAC.1
MAYSRLPLVCAHGLIELLKKGMWLHALAQKRLAANCIELSRRLPSHRAASLSRVAATSRLGASGSTASGSTSRV